MRLRKHCTASQGPSRKPLSNRPRMRQARIRRQSTDPWDSNAIRGIAASGRSSGVGGWGRRGARRWAEACLAEAYDWQENRGMIPQRQRVC